MFAQPTQSNNRIFTVSTLNAQVRVLLENEMGIVWLVGELSNFSMPVSGHWYFTLKDARAQVKCAMFKGN
ncbi:exodeoxyribonuclease VII large subunit, partial [Photobacterium damselae subsp. damselae]|nr:exodeoxyribonuclease VII large subunit [Photobacterium damselae subsp. damselae]